MMGALPEMGWGREPEVSEHGEIGRTPRLGSKIGFHSMEDGKPWNDAEQNNMVGLVL